MADHHTHNRCRVCNQILNPPPMLRYDHMPKSAQFLPLKEELSSDQGVSISLYQCLHCGLIQLNNEPVFYFREVIRAAGISPEITSFRLDQFRKFLKCYSLTGKKCIEIGCGFGEYLELLDRCGAKAYGLEFAKDAVKHCTEKNLRASRGFIDSVNYKIDGGPFSAFFILNFLEHLPEPIQTLKGICNNLTDDGVGIVEVPNVDMIIEKALFSEFTTDHLLYFTQETLSTTLSMSGFEVLECRPVWHDYIICAHVRKRRKPAIQNFYKQKKQLRNELDNFFKDFHPDRVAIWGAGHQALAVMALFELQDKVRFVIDSAAFKQGRFTPVSHIRIVPPHCLDSHTIHAIVVMAASYSDEVVGIIQQNYGNHIKIAVLRNNALDIINNPSET